MRVLHVVGRMERGGVETWLMHVLRQVDPDDIHMDFLVHSTEPAQYDNEIRERGSLIIPCLDPKNPLQYALNFRTAIQDHGPYDVVHSHVHHFSGYVLWLAHKMGVQTLIAHCHNDTRVVEEQAGKPRHMYLTLMKHLVSRYADYGLAPSRMAAEDLFGPNWADDPRWRILNYGIDLQPFKQSVNRRRIREELCIPEEAFVVGHVGRFVEQKNHAFLIDIANETVKAADDIHFLLVGDGPLRPAIERKVESLELRDKISFIGVRADIPRLMMGAMDAFILPSLHEGLGIVLVEAQSAGIPCVLSDVVPDEADVVIHLIKRLPLNGSAAIWASAILDLHDQESLRDPHALTLVEQSAFNIRTSVKELVRVYERCY